MWKKVITKGQKVLGTNSYFGRSRRGKTGRDRRGLIYTKKVKKTALNRLKIKKIFSIDTHDLQAQNFLINQLFQIC